MKKFLLGAVGLLALSLSAPASAADLAARPYTKAPPMVAAMYDWSGFYLGLNGGYGSSRKCWDDVFFGADGCHDATGGTAGGQIGYRWQSSAYVFGLEAQGNWADFRGSNVSVLTPAFTNTSKIDAFGLFTGQVGFAVNTALFYLKGGAAVTHDRFSISTSPNGNPPNTLVANTGDQTRWGGVAGVGIEWAFLPNWSAAVEYDHMWMQDKNTIFLTTPAPAVLFATDRIRQDVDLVTVRVNYRWGGPVIAKY